MLKYHLGLAYSLGEGVPQDYGESVQWHRRRRRTATRQRPNHAGSRVQHRKGVSQDHEEVSPVVPARREQQHANAQFFLGTAYSSGRRATGLHLCAHVAEHRRRSRQRGSPQGAGLYRRREDDARTDSRSSGPSAGMDEQVNPQRCGCGAPLPPRKNWPAVRAKQFFENSRKPDPRHHLCDECYERKKKGLPALTKAESESRRRMEINAPNAKWERVERGRSPRSCYMCGSGIRVGASSCLLPSGPNPDHPSWMSATTGRTT